MPSGVSQVDSSTPLPVVSLTALAQSPAEAAPRAGPARRRRSRGCQLPRVPPSSRSPAGARGRHAARRPRRSRRRRRRRPRPSAQVRLAGQPDLRRARGPELGGQPGGRLRVDPVGGADAGDRREAAARPSAPSPGRVSMPPAWKRLAANERAGGVPGDRADRGQEDRGRAVRSAAASAASRSASNACAARTRGRPPDGAVGGGLAGRQLLGEVRELADAGDRFAARGDPLRPGRPRWRRAGRAPDRGQRRGEAAGPLDLGEPVPGRRASGR